MVDLISFFLLSPSMKLELRDVRERWSFEKAFPVQAVELKPWLWK
jgi:hypothetical protein